MPRVSVQNTAQAENTSGGVYAHGQPVKEGNETGVAVKQLAPPWNASFGEHSEIAIGEPFLIIKNGAVQVDGAFSLGEAVYINDSNVLVSDELSDEVQTITVDATGGTFTLTVGGDTTDTIAYNASAATLRSALEATSYVAAGDVIVTKPSTGFWRVVFDLALADVNVTQMTANAGSLTGGAGTAVVATETQGGGALGTPFGRVVDTASGNRGVPAGKVIIDLDIKTAVAGEAF